MKKQMKTILAAALTAMVVFGAAGCSKSAPNEETSPAEVDGSVSQTSTADAPKKIGILQLVEHDALDAAREGFLAALAEGGYEDGRNVTIDFQNAQNDQSNLKTMSQKFVNDKNDLILAIATPAAQSVATETTEIPILGTAITDYAEAGLVESNEAPNGNLSGTSDKTPVKEQFDLLKQILPEAKTVGIMYNSSEANSEIQAKMAEEAAKALGLSCEFATVTTTNDITQAVQSLVGKADVLYIPTDNTFASAMASVASVTNDAKLPVIVGEVGMCSGGGLATLGINYYTLGEQTGKMAIRVLEGEDISKMPIEYTDNADLCINLDIAKEINVTIPQSILDSASIIIENGETVKK